MRSLAPHDDLFPIRDAESAKLMVLKARRLHTAGVIGAAEREKVLRRAELYLNGAGKPGDRAAPKASTSQLLLT